MQTKAKASRKYVKGQRNCNARHTEAEVDGCNPSCFWVFFLLTGMHCPNCTQDCGSPGYHIRSCMGEEDPQFFISHGEAHKCSQTEIDMGLVGNRNGALETETVNTLCSWNSMFHSCSRPASEVTSISMVQYGADKCSLKDHNCLVYTRLCPCCVGG